MNERLTRQLTLGVQLHDEATFANFHPGDNQHIVAALQQLLSVPTDPFIYLWGRSGSGCTHLLQAACQLATQSSLSAFYLSLADFSTLSTTVFDDLEQVAVVCLDDLQAIAGSREWEEALFHFYNRAQAAGTRVVLASHFSPRQLNFVLPDLSSRLLWCAVYQLLELSDAHLTAALIKRAACRGLTLTAEVASFLIRRHTRDMESLLALLDKLDKASLSAQRPLTIPFVKLALAD